MRSTARQNCLDTSIQAVIDLDSDDLNSPLLFLFAAKETGSYGAEAQQSKQRERRSCLGQFLFCVSRSCIRGGCGALVSRSCALVSSRAGCRSGILVISGCGAGRRILCGRAAGSSSVIGCAGRLRRRIYRSAGAFSSRTRRIAGGSCWCIRIIWVSSRSSAGGSGALVRSGCAWRGSAARSRCIGSGRRCTRSLMTGAGIGNHVHRADLQ